MGTNRTQPFGYRMERGKVVIDPDEFRWVVYIYERYIQGASFKQISDTLCCTGIGYDVDKTWNKNMVARIKSILFIKISFPEHAMTNI